MAENKYYGIYQGTVVDVNDSEKRGRIRVTCPDVLGGKTVSAWCDPVIPVAYDNGGDFYIPPKNELVWLMFIGGEPNKPVYLGSWWQEGMSPIGDDYEKINDFRIIKYADCTITMMMGKLIINVGAGVCDLQVEHNKVTVKGNLVVEGNVSAYNVSAGTVSAVKGKDGGGTVSVDDHLEVKTLTASEQVTANGIAFTTHKHTAYGSGSATSTPY